MPIAAPIVAGLISAGSGIVDAITQGATNRKNRDFAREMYGKQRQDALADFQMQNEYNSPVKQMQRLRDAKLNPNLIYGNGTTATGTAQPVRSSSVSPGNAKAPEFGFANSISSYIQMKQADSEIDLRKTQQIVNMIEAVMKGKQTENIATDTASKSFDLGLKQDLRNTHVAAAAASLNKTLADTQFTIDQNARANALQAPTLTRLILEAAKIRMDNAKTSQEIEEIKARVNNILTDTKLKAADVKLKEQGIQPHDSALSRFIQGLFYGQPSEKIQKIAQGIWGYGK